jgi:transcriptional regulator with XRE-family HTH domain
MWAGTRRLRHLFRHPFLIFRDPQGGTVSVITEKPTYAQALGARLRDARRSLGYSLQQVEVRSRGRWTVSSLGSYERGSRMMTVTTLDALARYYGVSVRDLLPDEPPERRAPRVPRVVLNLPTLAAVPDDRADLLRRWVAEIRRERDDHGGRVLSIRQADLRALASLYDLDVESLFDLLQGWDVLDPSSDLLDPKPGRHPPPSRPPAD